MNLLDFLFGRKVVVRKKRTKVKSPKIEALRKEAKKILPARLKELADSHGFKYNRVGIRNAKTRWGSCSWKNNINLNMHLIKLSDDLIDYVILHELCHTIEKNHSQKFWTLLEKHLPDAKLRRKKLKKVYL